MADTPGLAARTETAVNGNAIMIMAYFFFSVAVDSSLGLRFPSGHRHGGAVLLWLTDERNLQESTLLVSRSLP